MKTIVRFFGTVIGGAVFAVIFQHSVYAGSPYDRLVVVTNKTEYGVMALYGSRASSTSWESNILTGRYIGPMRQLSVNFSDGSGACLIDLRADMSNGQKIEHRNFDACSLNEWTLYQQ